MYLHMVPGLSQCPGHPPIAGPTQRGCSCEEAIPRANVPSFLLRTEPALRTNVEKLFSHQHCTLYQDTKQHFTYTLLFFYRNLMVELSISVTLGSAGRFLIFRHLPEENQRVTIPLGIQCPSLLALGIITNPCSLSSCGELLRHNTAPCGSTGSLCSCMSMEVLDHFPISSNKSILFPKKPLCFVQIKLFGWTHPSTPDLFKMTVNCDT